MMNIRRHITAIGFVFLIASQAIQAQRISEWRGEGRKGVYSCENMLRSWPEGGPEMIWINRELPKGYSSVSFNSDFIFLSGIEGDQDVLVALDPEGEIVWKTPFGRAWMESFSDSRSTPTVEGNRIYVCSGMGDLACIDAADGNIVWSKQASELHGGTYGYWGIAESLLVDEEKVYFAPGGPETHTIALNKANGELVWKSLSLNENPGYVSPIFVERDGGTLLVNVTAHHVVALDVDDGSFVWTFKHSSLNADQYDEEWEFVPGIKCVTPLYHDNQLYITGGYNHGGMMLELSEKGDSVSLLWFDTVLDVHHGGVVLMDEKIFGANWLHNGDGNWCCIDWKTGEVHYEEHWNNKGSLISVEDMLLVYDEKRGNVGLVEPSTDRFDLVSSFRITEGSGPHWAHPVIHQGQLYIRRGEALMVYDISGRLGSL